MYSTVLKFNFEEMLACTSLEIQFEKYHTRLEIQFWKSIIMYLGLFDQSGNVPCMHIVNIFSVETQVVPRGTCVHLSWSQSTCINFQMYAVTLAASIRG